MKTYFVYILTNKRNGTLYVGFTSNLINRITQHKNHEVMGFTQKYSLEKLVYYEEYEYVYDAINREKNIKKWNRAWKLELIEKVNPKWEDLSHNL